MRWTFRQRRFQELLTVPQSMRPEGYRTDSQIAESLGVALMTLKGWRLEAGWWEAVSDIASAFIGEHLAEIYEAMVHQAVSGSVQAAKFCLSVLGLENRELNVNVRHYEDDRLIVFLPAERKEPPLKEIEQPPTIEGRIVEPVEKEEDDLLVVL